MKLTGRLHVTTIIVLEIVASVMLLQLWIIGPYYWSDSVLVECLLAGMAILVGVGTAVEWKVRATGKLFRFNRVSVLLLMLMTMGFVYLSVTPSGPFCCSGDESYAYGCPEDIVFRTQHFERVSPTERQPTFVSWSCEYRTILYAVVMYVLMFVAIAVTGEWLAAMCRWMFPGDAGG